MPDHICEVAQVVSFICSCLLSTLILSGFKCFVGFLIPSLRVAFAFQPAFRGVTKLIILATRCKTTSQMGEVHYLEGGVRTSSDLRHTLELSLSSTLIFGGFWILAFGFWRTSQPLRSIRTPIEFRRFLHCGISIGHCQVGCIAQPLST